MTNILKRLICLISCLLIIGCAQETSAPQTKDALTAADLVLLNVNIVDVEAGSIIAGQDVFVTGTRISNIIPHGQSSISAVRTHDAEGQYLAPGLWDMHAHIRANSHADNLPMFIAYGVTGLRDLGLTNHKLLKEWRKNIETGDIIGPRILTSGTIIEGAEPRFPSSVAVGSVEGVKPALEALMTEDVDLVKLFQNIPGDAFEALVAEARANGLTTAGHIPTGWDQIRAAKTGLGSIEHLFGIGDTLSGYEDNTLDTEELDRLAEALIENNVYQSPTLVNLEYFVKLSQSYEDPAREAEMFENDARLDYVPNYFKAWWAGIRARNREAFSPEDYQRFEKRLELNGRIITELSNRGVKVLAGTDVPNPYIVAGISLHDELDLYVDAGLTPAEALRTATLYPAQYFGKPNDFGVVKTDALADLILLGGNPLEDIAQTRDVRGVLANGRFFAPPALDKIRMKQRALLAQTNSADFDQVTYMDARRNGIAALRAKYPNINSEGSPYTLDPNHLRRLSKAMADGLELEDARLALDWNIALFPEDTASYTELSVLSVDEDSAYFGQTPPGLTPRRFAPDVISTQGAFELNAVFSPDGSQFFFSRRINDKFKIFQSRRNENSWSTPKIVSFSQTDPNSSDVDMAFTPNGERLYFISDRPMKAGEENAYNIFYTDLDGDTWSEPTPLPAPINSDAPAYYPVIVEDGSLYFTTEGRNSIGGTDSYRASWNGDGFGEPENLGAAVNSPQSEGDIFVAPDESYLIHVATGRNDSLGSGDLYISFRNQDGSWGNDIHMGNVINSEGLDFCPMMTPDGRYFFFSRGGDIFWVDAQIIETFRP